MKYYIFGSTYFVRLDGGEEIIGALVSLCEKDRIGAGHFSGLGAVREAELGWFDPGSSSYATARLTDPCEIVSLYGNITVVDGKPFIHAHAALAGRDLAVKGGHLRRAVVSVTCEITLTMFRDDIGRKKDEETGLPLLDLKPGEG